MASRTTWRSDNKPLVSAQEYLAPVKLQQFEQIIKRSRFITHVAPVLHKAQAKPILNEIKARYSDANHHCWAMIAGAPDNVFEQDQSDDGEPKGTAGKPMLNVLIHSGLGNTLVVVTRYFGGVKLGTGGLVRAYSSSVAQALSALDTQTRYQFKSLRIRIPYTLLDTFNHWLSDKHIEQVEASYETHVTLELMVPVTELRDLEDFLHTYRCDRYHPL